MTTEILATIVAILMCAWFVCGFIEGVANGIRERRKDGVPHDDPR